MSRIHIIRAVDIRLKKTQEFVANVTQRYSLLCSDFIIISLFAALCALLSPCKEKQNGILPMLFVILCAGLFSWSTNN